jgi:1,4-dihydroxy-2-naphthoate octaprenyltransferase
MNFKTFLNFTRIQTLPVGVIPILSGILYAGWRFDTIKPIQSLLLLLGLAFINLFVSAWNNVMDYLKAKDENYRHGQNILSTRNIPVPLALVICIVLFILASVCGLALVPLTNLAILPIGVVCFGIAVFYTFGPFAFSRWPLGEILAGFAEGISSFFLGVYVNTYTLDYLSLNPNLSLNIDWKVLVPILIVGLAFFPQNFNVMLADNICDLEQDVKNDRRTLPYFIGLGNALRLWVIMYVFAYIMIAHSIFTGNLPWVTGILLILAAMPIFKNIKIFLAKQSKKETFFRAIQNLTTFEMAFSASMVLGMIINLF